jgi:hypothetical protein
MIKKGAVGGAAERQMMRCQRRHSSNKPGALKEGNTMSNGSISEDTLL